jgi:hypothetical protein
VSFIAVCENKWPVVGEFNKQKILAFCWFFDLLFWLFEASMLREGFRTLRQDYPHFIIAFYDLELVLNLLS